MCKGITAQFRLQHFARPGGREASFFDMQNVRQRLDGRRLNDPFSHHRSPWQDNKNVVILIRPTPAATSPAPLRLPRRFFCSWTRLCPHAIFSLRSKAQRTEAETFASLLTAALLTGPCEHASEYYLSCQKTIV